MPMISFDTPWKHQKNSVYLIFSGVSKEISGMKWVNGKLQKQALEVFLPIVIFTGKHLRRSLRCFPVNNAKFLETCSIVEVVSRRCFLKPVVLRILEYSRGKQLCWSLFLVKLQAFSPPTLLKRLQHMCFLVNF